jgi:hypothetical protein
MDHYDMRAMQHIPSDLLMRMYRQDLDLGNDKLLKGQQAGKTYRNLEDFFNMHREGNQYYVPEGQENSPSLGKGRWM